MKPLRHTGDSANIAYYAEPTSRHGDVWAEVLRSDVAHPPRFYITVRRIGVGEVARRRYVPRKPVPPGRLADAIVTRLVREALRSS